MIVFENAPWTVIVAVVVGLAGVGLWIVSWFLPRGSIRQRRLSDFGSVLIFGGMLVRYAAVGGPRNGLEWMLCVLAVVFLALALWNLFRTHDQRPR